MSKTRKPTNSKTKDVESTVEWKHLNWVKLERRVYKLQKRIYKASVRGDVKAARRLQKTLMKSWSGKCLAVRKVTQDNQGKKTAGVDGVKSLTPKQRVALIANLNLGSKVQPTRRIWIPKPGKDEKRPLGIPTIHDRALQTLVKQAIKPEWEAKFESNSFGFRPGRSCHDAIEAIYLSIRQKPKFVLDADITKCFDKINHSKLLEKLNTSPSIRRQIRAWLRAGVVDNQHFQETLEGTPQGGVISPLLANIALHGMEERIKRFAQTLPGGKRENTRSISLIRYADDFVIMHKDLSVVQECQRIITEWLNDMGLELKPSKTRLTHTLNKFEDSEPGFNFLGFNIKQHSVGKYHSKQGFKTIITPSKEKQKIHYEQISTVINNHKAVSQEALIINLNPIIRGWSNYYSTVVSKESYSHLDSLVYLKLRAWAHRRHSRKSRKWKANKYWRTIGNDNWTFSTPQGNKRSVRLLKHAETPIVRHAKVKGEASPYNGDFVYWSSRMGTHPEMPTRNAKLLKKQKGKCANCGLFFKNEDWMEVDHIIPRSKGGKDEYKNLQLLHKHCHDIKTADDGSNRGTHDNELASERSPMTRKYHVRF
ncbi:MAG: group II intron reverse transcriptase/maturase [Cyanobacteria bacterium J06635_10]